MRKGNVFDEVNHDQTSGKHHRRELLAAFIAPTTKHHDFDAGRFDEIMKARAKYNRHYYIIGREGYYLGGIDLPAMCFPQLVNEHRIFVLSSLVTYCDFLSAKSDDVLKGCLTVLRSDFGASGQKRHLSR
jgi:hypothetical protein